MSILANRKYGIAPRNECVPRPDRLSTHTPTLRAWDGRRIKEATINGNSKRVTSNARRWPLMVDCSPVIVRSRPSHAMGRDWMVRLADGVGRTRAAETAPP